MENKETGQHLEDRYGISEEDSRAVIDSLSDESQDTSRKLLSGLHPADIAHLINITNSEQRRKIIDIIVDNFDPEILTSVNPQIIPLVCEMIGDKNAAALIADIEPSDAVYILDSLNNDQRQYVLEMLPEPVKIQVLEGLAYPEGSAGRIMQKKFVAIPQYWTVGQTIDFLKKNNNLPENFYEIIVVNSVHKPIGGLLVSKLVASDNQKFVSQIMNTDVKAVVTTDDQEEVSYLFKQYALVSVPVVNREGKLVGIIELDDILEVVGEEAEEDILLISGVSHTDIYSGFMKTVSHRFPWLFVQLVAAVVNTSVIGLFTDTIQQLVILAAIMPIVASVGGSAGMQTAIVAVRALAMREITTLNAARFIVKEVLASAVNGILLALIGALVIFLYYKNLNVSLVFAGAIIINIAMAGLVGTIVPLFLEKSGTDPAVSSTVFLTFITDIIGYLVFLLLASLTLVHKVPH